MTGGRQRRYLKREDALLYESAIQFLHWAGMTVYGGTLLVFAVLLSIPTRRSGLGRHRLLTAFRAWGPALGLAMGCMILGGLLWHYRLYGAFTLSLDSSAGQLQAGKYALFFLLWLSSFQLEIWTLEPLRREELEADTQLAATLKAIRQIRLNALLFVAVAALAWCGRLSA